MKTNDILIRPILTEKATNAVKNQVYAFEVHRQATKHQVKEIVEKLYPVKVSSIKVMVRKGKEKKVGKRMVPKRLADRKIAMVKVKEGKIDLFPQT